ncbi:hypothetical protein CDD80_7403 [Ophiocordyceps camponoti-rufipedis]|uniref:Uncharacterized protein n=1 Tax=Ophiocordyceps camponoti-rufipedis TaxID=2004952 RepID=A0A2C5YMS3_9HYPO|nr:hypothetical protein CDD80_7403 [Ophiocordyceps camponoti-rufipedis]
MPPAAPTLADLDAHQQPPSSLRAAWKQLTRLEPDECPIDNHLAPSTESGFSRVSAIDRQSLARAFSQLRPGDGEDCADADADVPSAYVS